MVVRALLLRGMFCGAVAGILSFVFARLLGEGPIGSAIDFESQKDQAAGIPSYELVTRDIQSTVGLATAVLIFGVAIGGIFGLAFAAAYGRLGRLSARTTAAVLALSAFLVVFIVPFLKYPANPPAVGQPETIGIRTLLYLTMIAASVLFAVGALVLGRRLADRLGAWNAGLVAAALFVVGVGVAMALLPVINEVPADFPATVLWQFRVASLGIQAVLWATVGLLFGWLTERTVSRLPQRIQRLAGAPAPRERTGR